MSSHERIPSELSQSPEEREKPEFVYHGSTQGAIEEFEPRKRYTPGALQDQEVPPAIYAGDDPAYAAAHAFSWGSSEGFELGYSEGKVLFGVPKKLAHRLEQRVWIYKLASDQFEALNIEPKGHNFWSKVGVKPVEPAMEFESVRAAIEHFGGQVLIIPEQPTLEQ